MPTLHRHDGSEFVIQPYRELLSHKKASLLKKEVRLLSQNNGEYARLFKQADGQVEAVFSREQGYLLGEAVWRYFGCPEDLIYCEALPDRENAILVIVRNGKVYLDAKVPFNNLRDEFASLVSGYNNFIIYIYGDVPLSDFPGEGKFVFDKSYVKSFNELDTPLFEILPVDDSLRLLNIEQAITAQRIGNHSPHLTLILFFFIIIVIIIMWFHHVQQATNLPIIDNNDAAHIIIQEKLASPEPHKLLQQVTSAYTHLYQVPGWQPEKINFTQTQVIIKAHSLGGSIHHLYRWAKQHHATVTIATEHIELIIPLHLPRRSVPTQLPATQNVMGVILDRMMTTIPEKSITLLGNKNFSHYQTISTNINFRNVSPDILRLIGLRLSGLPVELTHGEITITHGLLSGKLYLTIIGT